MLDLETVLIVTLAVSTLQSFIWICGWRAWREMFSLKYFAAGFSMITLGLLFMVIRGNEPAPVGIVVHNVTIKIGLVLLSVGLGRFLGQPTFRRFSMALLLGYTLFWVVAVSLDPGNIALRIHSSTLFTIVLMMLMSRNLLVDRSQSAWLRYATVFVLIGYMLSSIIQTVIEIRLPEDFQSAAVLEDRHAWYLLIGALFLISFFACLVLMVGERLSASLRQQNAILTDEVAKRRELEARLGASLEAERSLREEQADFVRVVGHEFRTPLAVIRNSVDMLALSATPSASELAQRHANIRDSLERMFGLIDRFMGGDRDPGAFPEWTRAEALLSQLVLHFEMTGEAARLQVAPSPGAVDCWLYIDPGMVETAAINLIDNALKYSPGGSAVEIGANVEEGEFRLQIRDHGIGIPEAERHKIGRRFFRASNVQAGTGTGLGLHLVRRLLGYQSGRLELSPAAGGGTLAVIRLPLSSMAGQAPEDGVPA